MLLFQWNTYNDIDHSQLHSGYDRLDYREEWLTIGLHSLKRMVSRICTGSLKGHLQTHQIVGAMVL